MERKLEPKFQKKTTQFPGVRRGTKKDMNRLTGRWETQTTISHPRLHKSAALRPNVRMSIKHIRAPKVSSVNLKREISSYGPGLSQDGGVDMGSASTAISEFQKDLFPLFSRVNRVIGKIVYRRLEGVHSALVFRLGIKEPSSRQELSSSCCVEAGLKLLTYRARAEARLWLISVSAPKKEATN
ncbi:hypothetical protein B0H13DRAFT_1850241 [Mycena leptocephala]|nr:hypothetical protein B0H13DRAFT_1850241 [Mycena leptocephala]